MLMARGEMASAVMAMLILGVFIAAFDGASSAAMAELFPTRVRFGGIALAGNIVVALLGGFTPWFSVYLMKTTGNPFSPAGYVIAAALVTFLTVIRAKETAGKPLPR